jgi:hypothetical protein
VASIAAIAGPIPSFVTFAILLTVFANGIFLINFLWSLATTLEWSVPALPPAEDFGLSDPVVYRGAYEFSVPDVAEDFVLQHLAAACQEIQGEIRKEPPSEGSRRSRLASPENKSGE